MHQDQLAALGQLAAGLAHELRNPLTSIKTLVEAARGSGGENPLDDQDLQVIEEEIARLDETLQSFLDYARPPKLTRRRVDVRDVIDRTVQLVGPRAERQFVNVLSRLPDHPVEAILDPEQLRQVLLNLLLNAVDALSGGGRVTISLVEEAETGLIRLTVEDDGPGIREELLGRLFEPFVSTKPSGTGLGLTVCRRIIDGHGGSITAENRPEGGARFTILLPRQTEPVPAPAQAAYACPVDY
jgi:signal transduction histidine kinase